MVNLKKSSVDLFKYSKGENKSQNTFFYTLNAGRLASVQSI